MKIKILQQFCGIDESRPTLMHPWTWGEFTYASDGRIIIRVPRVSEVIASEKAPIQQDRVDYLFSLDGEYLGFKAAPKPPEGGWGEPCAVCWGEGKSNRVWCDSCEAMFEIKETVTCNKCDGRGRILWGHAFEFGKHKLNHFYLDKLSLLPVPFLAEHKDDPYSELAIKFHGGSGRLMPMKTRQLNQTMKTAKPIIQTVLEAEKDKAE